MMSINTVIRIAILPSGARIQPRQKGNGINLIEGGTVIVDKGTAITLGARSPEESDCCIACCSPCVS